MYIHDTHYNNFNIFHFTSDLLPKKSVMFKHKPFVPEHPSDQMLGVSPGIYNVEVFSIVIYIAKSDDIASTHIF